MKFIEVRVVMRRVFPLIILIMGAFFVCHDLADPAAADSKNDFSAAICPLVYALDESSAERGYRYIFYGNAFFIDQDGYLLTAAHVLTDFRDGGQPQVLLRLPDAPPRLIKVELVAADSQRDIAILRAVPNPFRGRYQLAVLSLSSSKPLRGDAVFAAALRPAHLKDPHTFDAPQEDQSFADVVQYTSLALNKGQPESELFLFNHEVLRGQSGAPILSRETREVVGIVEGQWLRGIPLSAAASAGNRGSTMGAGVPITYALELLARHHVAWQTSSSSSR